MDRGDLKKEYSENEEAEIKVEPNAENAKVSKIKESPEDDIVNEEDAEPAILIKKLRDKLKKCSAERQEYLAGWQRAKADSINSRRRDEEEKKRFIKFACQDLLLDLVQVMDSFDMAFGNKELWQKVDQEWRKGVEMIHSQLLDLMKSQGLEEIKSEGVKYDPAIHDAVSNIETSDKAKDQMIDKVLHRGYKLEENVVRAARVSVYVFKG